MRAGIASATVVVDDAFEDSITDVVGAIVTSTSGVVSTSLVTDARTALAKTTAATTETTNVPKAIGAERRTLRCRMGCSMSQ